MVTLVFAPEPGPTTNQPSQAGGGGEGGLNIAWVKIYLYWREVIDQILMRELQSKVHIGVPVGGRKNQQAP